MNISHMILTAKEKIDGYERRKVLKKAKSLENMRNRRIELEGRARILKTASREKERTKKARASINQHSTLNQLKKALEERKKGKKEKPKLDFSTRNMF